jgi:hypothetical protein
MFRRRLEQDEACARSIFRLVKLCNLHHEDMRQEEGTTLTVGVLPSSVRSTSFNFNNHFNNLQLKLKIILKL